MVRIATSFQNQALLADINRNQASLADLRQQVSTGKRADTVADLADQASVLFSARDEAARNAQSLATAQDVTRRLEIQDVQLSELASLAEEAQQLILTAQGTNSGTGLVDGLEGIVDRASAILNTRFEGNFLFGGGLNAQAPSSVTSFADLVALPVAADAFQNGILENEVEIVEGDRVRIGLRADTLAQDFFAALKDVADFNAGPNGPFAQDLTDAQLTFLSGQVGVFQTAVDGLNNAVGLNGLQQQRTEATVERIESQQLILETFISQVEDTNLAEAAAEIGTLEQTVEASLRVLAQVNRISLLDFI